METVEERPGLAATLRALNAALGRPASLWVKESSARNLRHRDFLAPRAALGAAYDGGQVGRPREGRQAAGRPRRGAWPGRVLTVRSSSQVPSDVIAAVTALGGPGVLAVRGCRQTAAGLEVQLRRCEAFRRLLGHPPGPGPAPLPGPEAAVVLHCPALRCPGSVSFSAGPGGRVSPISQRFLRPGPFIDNGWFTPLGKISTHHHHYHIGLG